MNTEEYLDIVDNEGNLTGERELRGIVHEKGLWHRTVHVYFYRKTLSGIELMVHLRSKDKTGHPNCWDTRFGGHLEAGQAFEDAAEREVLEETGVSIEAGNLLAGQVRSHDGENNREITQVYYHEFDGDPSNMAFPDGEVQEARWMAIDAIREAVKTETNWTMSERSFGEIASELAEKLD